MRPVDLQTAIPRATEASAAQGARHQAPETAQRQLVSQMQARADRDPGRVPSAEQGQGQKVDRRQPGEQGGGQNPGSEANHDEESQQSKSEDEKGNQPGDPAGSLGRKLDIRM